MSAPARTRSRMSQGEFIAMVAVLFATVAFSIDAMLPAMPEIAAELSPDAPNRGQFIVTSFVFGMGLGTLVVGPLSDAFGRKPLIIWGGVLYIIGAVAAYFAESLEVLLAARVLQGLGAAGPRAVTIAIVRDLYAGRTMAKIMSFAMMIFALIPAVAPMMGAGIIALSDWRGIFLAFIVFSIFSAGWVTLRQPETLPVEKRRPLNAGLLWSGVVEIFSNRMVVLTIAVLTLCFGMLFAALVSTQPIFDETFDMNDSFPYWFAVIAVLSIGGSVTNARFVERLGMRYLVTVTLSVQIVLSGVMAAVCYMDLLPTDGLFWAYFLWTTSVFFMAGLTMGNLNAMAMEPLGHLTGLASSVVSSVATVLAVAVAAPIGLAFDGTPAPVALGVAICAVIGVILTLIMGPGPRRQETTAQDTA